MVDNNNINNNNNRKSAMPNTDYSHSVGTGADKKNNFQTDLSILSLSLALFSLLTNDHVHLANQLQSLTCILELILPDL